MISYNNRGQFRGAVDASGQALDILVLVPKGAIGRGKLCPQFTILLDALIFLRFMMLNGGRQRSTPSISSI